MKGIIYRIIGVSHPEIQYVGSTTNELRYRWQSHKNYFKIWSANKDKYGKCAIYPYFELYGIADFIIVKIKEYNVCDKKHLSAYEQLWMNKIKCVNKYKALRGYECKFFQKYERMIWRDNNKEYMKDYLKEWRVGNVRHIQQKKEYNIKNKDKRRARDQAPIICECGKEVNHSGVLSHKKSAQHKLFETDGVKFVLKPLMTNEDKKQWKREHYARNKAAIDAKQKEYYNNKKKLAQVLDTC